jgi:hypothetical protein
MACAGPDKSDKEPTNAESSSPTKSDQASSDSAEKPEGKLQKQAQAEPKKQAPIEDKKPEAKLVAVKNVSLQTKGQQIRIVTHHARNGCHKVTKAQMASKFTDDALKIKIGSYKDYGVAQGMFCTQALMPKSRTIKVDLKKWLPDKASKKLLLSVDGKTNIYELKNTSGELSLVAKKELSSKMMSTAPKQLIKVKKLRRSRPTQTESD